MRLAARTDGTDALGEELERARPVLLGPEQQPDQVAGHEPILAGSPRSRAHGAPGGQADRSCGARASRASEAPRRPCAWPRPPHARTRRGLPDRASRALLRPDSRRGQLGIELETRNSGEEARKRDGRGRPRPPIAGPSAQLITAPARARRVQADRPRRAGRRGRRRAARARVERVGVRRRDAPEPVPVRAARRQRERTRGVTPSTALGVERVEQREEVVLIGAPACGTMRSPARRPAGAPVGQGSRLRPGRGIGQRGEHLLDLVAQILEARRQDRRLAQVRGVFVDGEAPARRIAISNRTPPGSRK